MIRRANQSGFTLVETLVALAIVGLSLAVLLRIVSDNLDRTRRLRNEALAASLAQSLIAQSQAGTPTDASGASDGGFAWHIHVAPYAGAGADWPVDAVTVAATVSWREDGQILSRTLSTLRVVPKAVQP
jgi:general secretion pathway protein I